MPTQDVADAHARLAQQSQRFGSEPDAKARLKLLVETGRELPRLDDAAKTALNRVMGCVAQVRAAAL